MEYAWLTNSKFKIIVLLCGQQAKSSRKSHVFFRVLSIRFFETLDILCYEMPAFELKNIEKQNRSHFHGIFSVSMTALHHHHDSLSLTQPACTGRIRSLVSTCLLSYYWFVVSAFTFMFSSALLDHWSRVIILPILQRQILGLHWW